MLFSGLRRMGCVFALLIATTVFGGDSKPKSMKVIDFEDELVEGLNRRPLDSLAQVGDADKRRRKPHLYRKRIGFSSELAETLRAMKYQP